MLSDCSISSFIRQSDHLFASKGRCPYFKRRWFSTNATKTAYGRTGRLLSMLEWLYILIKNVGVENEGCI